MLIVNGIYKAFLLYAFCMTTRMTWKDWQSWGTAGSRLIYMRNNILLLSRARQFYYRYTNVLEYIRRLHCNRVLYFAEWQNGLLYFCIKRHVKVTEKLERNRVVWRRLLHVTTQTSGWKQQRLLFWRPCTGKRYMLLWKGEQQQPQQGHQGKCQWWWWSHQVAG